MNKIPIYFMPGMSSTSLIFEHIQLDHSLFEITYLEWLTPEKNESLEHYSKRMANEIKHPNPVLIGVSFGGVIVQEISKLITTEKIIIISSVKSTKEFPPLYSFAKKTKVYKLLPTQWSNKITSFIKLVGTKKIKTRLNLYDKYLPLRDKEYLDWCIDNLLNWSQESALENVIHIQGEKDEVFPTKYMHNFTQVKQGTHAMIIVKAKWFSQHLPHIILKNNNEKNL